MPAIGFEIKRKCKVCGKVFLAKTLDSLYSSPKCSKVAWKRKKDAKEKNERLTQMAQRILFVFFRDGFITKFSSKNSTGHSGIGIGITICPDDSKQSVLK